jgi:hypothetical protein
MTPAPTRRPPRLEPLEDRLLPSALVPLAAADLNAQSAHLIGLDHFRADPRFSGIDGRGFNVVVIDTGVQANHPFLRGAVKYQWDFLNNDAVGEDTSGHGTHVASIIASRSATYPGVAPGAGIIDLRVLDGKGNGSFDEVALALQWVMAHAADYHVACVNLSFGDGTENDRGSKLYGVDDELAALAAANIPVIAAAGNDYGPDAPQGLSYPGADPSTIPVGVVWGGDAGGPFAWDGGATDNTTGPDRIVSFSEREAGSGELFAPGMLITAAAPGGGVATLSGTSMSTAVVSGVVTLAEQLAWVRLGRTLTLSEVRSLLSSTGDVIRDGDDENDNVPHTGAAFRRIDVPALADAIFRLPGGNAAPTLSGDGRLTAIPEDAPNPAGDNVFAVLGTTFHDFDPGARRGIAVIGLGGSGQGRWQYSLDGGHSWLDFGAVSQSAARLLRDTDKVRFVPAAYFTGTVTMSYLAWDQTSGSPGGVADLSAAGATGGRMAFSAAPASARLTVTAVNHAPVLTGPGRLSPVFANDANPPGDRVLDMVAGTVQDPDAGARAGAAVLGATGNGRWQFSRDGGQTWADLGAPSFAAARLLADLDRVRFVPAAGWTGQARLTYRAWDMTAGTAGAVLDLSSWALVGGKTAFSKEIGQAALTVGFFPQPQARTAAATAAPTLGSLLAQAGRPAGDAAGVAVVSAAGEGRWLYSLDGGGSWRDLGPVYHGRARLLPLAASLRFVPAGRGGKVGRLGYRLWDGRGVAGGTADLAGHGAAGGDTGFGGRVESVTWPPAAGN